MSQHPAMKREPVLPLCRTLKLRYALKFSSFLWEFLNHHDKVKETKWGILRFSHMHRDPVVFSMGQLLAPHWPSWALTARLKKAPTTAAHCVETPRPQMQRGRLRSLVPLRRPGPRRKTNCQHHQQPSRRRRSFKLPEPALWRCHCDDGGSLWLLPVLESDAPQHRCGDSAE